MKNVLITGAGGFIGKNLVAKLTELKDYNILAYDLNNTEEDLRKYIKEADFVVHLAGVNRPKDTKEFYAGNTGFTEQIISIIEEYNKNIPILITSSIQAELGNDYGKSKKQAEDILINYSQKNNAPIYIFRLPNVFGKWCRPNYNSAVATFCYNIAHDLEVWVSDENKELNLVYIDDVVEAFVDAVNEAERDEKNYYYEVKKVYTRTLGEIVNLLKSFRAIKNSLVIPNMNDEFVKVLYSTYLSYLEENDFSYFLNKNEDNRGCFVEVVKSSKFGQISVSKTHKGIVRGNHYHHTKVEKFIVIQGEAVIKFRKIDKDKVIEYKVCGEKPEVVDIPPGYTHSIENIGEEELITMFWANEMFDPNKPDTFFNEVERK